MSDTVIFEERTTASGHRLGIAMLNAEKSLNALTLDMIRQLAKQLANWEHDNKVVAVLLRGAGEKAFCAGGDVRMLRQALRDNCQYPNPLVTTFFSEEYALDYHIHTYRKPLIVWGSGIVMGGGLGLMAGASHRVVTASTRIAMPEITIGLYPDVAASWFLQRMPAHMGLFLGLTGAPLNAHDALLCNLADHLASADGWDNMLQQLASRHWSEDAENNRASITALLNELEIEARNTLPDSNVARHLLTVHRLLNRGTLSAVANALTHEYFTDPWLVNAAQTFANGSPTSAAITWEAFQRARHLSLAEVFRMELTLSVNVCNKPDFSEGVRALLVDKDRNPRWVRPTLQEVDQDWLNSHFISPWPVDAHPLAALAE
ncbi:MAG TPA: enoyl-CoA hydratase/isomerase family protein [Chromobacteriaceae bacterium]|nr:enoyl-CoA hydratase/isomerase family protein [Chromobacteriaceae bacterium]